ncbi:MAG: hypothetical protein ACE5EH_12875, partial [Gammaproteobacteria bacterium]
MKTKFNYSVLLLVMSMLIAPSAWAAQQTLLMGQPMVQIASSDMASNPCAKNPCGMNPCAKNPC